MLFFSSNCVEIYLVHTWRFLLQDYQRFLFYDKIKVLLSIPPWNDFLNWMHCMYDPWNDFLNWMHCMYDPWNDFINWMNCSCVWILKESTPRLAALGCSYFHLAKPNFFCEIFFKAFLEPSDKNKSWCSQIWNETF